ncbi:FAD-binding oxidoreductase [Desulfosoma sp.]|uniref:FAD-binding oxidoreductase n=1 Tax=Desulfosoma sp. TaxID=2603217 RepID=UPI00404A09AF
MSLEAIREFEKLLGSERVLTQPEHLERYTRATIPCRRIVIAALLPQSTEEVVGIVRIAQRHATALYPISTGKNWGYGSANPVRDHNILVDLSLMNKILHVDTRLAYAVIEPGVTQEQLHSYLEATGSGLMMDPTGAGPQCSVLGNALERGYGITPYGDHFANICGMEVVLADGTVLRTGFGHYAQCKATYVYRYGVGPYIDGLFTQSNLGIVTKMGLWLMPKPPYMEAFYFHVSQESALPDVVESIRELLLQGTLRSPVNLVHRDRALTLVYQYPWKSSQGTQPLHEAVAQHMAKKASIGIWNGIGALYGTKGEVTAARRVVRRTLHKHVKRLVFVNQRSVTAIKKLLSSMVPHLSTRLHAKIDTLEKSFGILNGMPSEISLKTPYWRSQRKPPAQNIDPAQDNCGLLWFTPVIPMLREEICRFVHLARSTVHAFGFEACFTFTAVTPRAFDCNFPILYKKEDPLETQRALACYESLWKACLREGFIPYRIGIQSMDHIVDAEDPFWQTVRKLKGALDPQGLLSPGRYSLV